MPLASRITAALVAVFLVFAFAGIFLPRSVTPRSFIHAMKNLPPPPPPPDLTMEAVELELGSRLVGVLPGEAHEVGKFLVEESRRLGFDPWFVVAIIEVESAYRVEACSKAGALGLMQLLPSTFRTVSSHHRITDPIENVRAGIAYLDKLWVSGFRHPATILRAYNGGPSNAIAYHKALRAKEDVSSFPEEMVEYPGKVLGRYSRLVHAAGGDYKHPTKTWRLK